MIGDRLKALRNEKNISQKKAANEINVDIQTIRAWERGTSEPRASEIVKIAQLYETSANEIVNDETNKNERFNARLQATEKLCEEERICIDTMIEAMLIRHHSKNTRLV